MTRRLLGLAIALRTKFYQGLKHKDTVPYVGACALMYKYKDNVEENVEFSMKDLCDKIIHADSISRPMEKDVERQITTLRGRDHRDKSEWELGISVSLFAEGVLNWAQDVEERPADESEARAAESVPAGTQSSDPQDVGGR